MSDKSRRKLLKSIAAGSGAIVAGKSLPESWTKPVVDSVMLPVHAQTSNVPLLSCESTAAPFGTSVPPGPNVDTTTQAILPMRVTVTPPPVAPDNVVTWDLYLDGIFLVTFGDHTLAADGTVEVTLGITGGNGVLESRFTWQAEQCSLFWNIFTTVPSTSAPSAISVN